MEESMKIAIDFDDTIAETCKDGFIPNLNNYQRAIMSPQTWVMDDFTTWDAAGTTGLDQDIIDGLFKGIDWDLVGAVPDAIEYIQKLIDDGRHDVSVVTANPNEEDIRGWMDDNGLKSVYLTSTPDKVAHLLRCGYDMLIDDNEQTCLTAHEAGLQVICFARPWNRGAPILTCFVWEHIYWYIKTHRSPEQRVWDAYEDLISEPLSLLTPAEAYQKGAIAQTMGDDDVVTNEYGAKQSRIQGRWDLLPFRAMESVTRVLKEGADKYGVDNWRGLSVDEINNHVWAHLATYQQTFDLEELEHAACRVLMALEIARGGGNRVLMALEIARGGGNVEHDSD
jgi:hypothetical protein